MGERQTIVDVVQVTMRIIVIIYHQRPTEAVTVLRS